MIPILSQIFLDSNSLNEYEKMHDTEYGLAFEDICMRLILLERKRNTQRQDCYYYGLGDRYLEKYKTLSDLLWRMPSDIAKEYLQEYGKTLYVKQEHFLEWMDLVCQVSPLWLIAARYLDRFTYQSIRKPKEIKQFISSNFSKFRYTSLLHPYIPELERLTEHSLGLNDLHVHLNGTTETENQWQYILENPYSLFKDFSQEYNRNAKVRQLSMQIVPDMSPTKLYTLVNNARQIRKTILLEIGYYSGLISKEQKEEIGKGGISEVRMLWNDFNPTSEYGKMIEELTFYLIVMDILRCSGSGKLASLFHHYMLIKGLVNQFLVMQHSQIGFEQFQLLTSNNFREGVEKDYKLRFCQMAGTNTIKYLNTVEGRFSPSEQVVTLKAKIDKIYSGYKEAKNTCGLLTQSNLRLVAHFIKSSESGKDKELNVRHRRLRTKLCKCAHSIVRLLEDYPSYRQKLVGVDAAASEFDAPPEVFAPIYRYLRKNGIRHFTYHVGEDFRHILTGIRHIYEAVDFLELYPGDRLGHCTAIGIPPSLWVQRNQPTTVISQGELLDNFVFVWTILEEPMLNKFQDIRPILENRISEYSYKVYGRIYSPYFLSQAWKLRKYDPVKYLYKDETCYEMPLGSEDKLEQVKVQKLYEQEGIKEILKKYHDGLQSQNARGKYDELVELNTLDIFTSDVLKAIQTYLLAYLTRKGIVIESLPTSNLRISFYESPYEYHIKRWVLPQKDERILPAIVLGSDDQGIFMTNIYNEYALVYSLLNNSEIGASEKTDKMRQLLQNSDIYRFENYE